MLGSHTDLMSWLKQDFRAAGTSCWVSRTFGLGNNQHAQGRTPQMTPHWLMPPWQGFRGDRCILSSGGTAEHKEAVWNRAVRPSNQPHRPRGAQNLLGHHLGCCVACSAAGRWARAQGGAESPWVGWHLLLVPMGKATC